jgi:hypothetical protein
LGATTGGAAAESWIGGERIVADFTVKPESAHGLAADPFGKALSQIPTLFGRLVYLASLRDAATGRYRHPALIHLMSAEEADRTLCHSHHQVFAQWLRFSLLEQKTDLDEYLSAGGRPAHASQFRDLVPPTARDVECQLYLTDLETLLELLKAEHGGAFSIPEA